MSNEQLPANKPKENAVQAFIQRVSAVKNVKDLLSFPEVHNRYVKNYEAGTGRKDGEHRYERDMFSFMEKVNNTPDLMKCDPMSIFAAFVKVGTYGVHPDKIYLKPVAVKDKLIMKADLDPFGKKEVMERMPSIKRVNDPVLVFKGDAFAYSPRDKRVTKHDQTWPTPDPTEESVVAVYVVVEFADGRIYDYILSQAEIKKRRNASKQPQGLMWSGHYGEACKKSVINYLWKVEYKTPDTAVLYQQYEAPAQTDDEEIPDADVQSDDAPLLPTETASEAKFDPAVNEETGEVYEKPEADKKKKKAKDEEAFI